MNKAKGALTDILEAVSNETEVGVSRIMSRFSDAETVDARWMCVKLLREHGYYPARISSLMGITPRYVQYILTDFEDRVAISRIMRNNYERAAKKLRNRSEPTA